jgi:hypothetical protein
MYDDPRMEIQGNSIVLHSPYNRDFVNDFKEDVPYTARRWNPTDKVWTFAPQYGARVRDLILFHYGVNVAVPATHAQSREQTTIVKLMYLGLPKDRGEGKLISYGWANGGWTTLWPLSVLKAWFEPMNNGDDVVPNAAQTLYGVLGVKRKASGAEIKSAWRKLARRFHPDMNSDPDATAQMQRVNEAYGILQDVGKRARYDAGLKLESAIGKSSLPRFTQSNVYRPPYRCGLVMVSAIEEVGRLNVKRILEWQDIVNHRGQILTTFWRFGDDRYSERWI